MIDYPYIQTDYNIDLSVHTGHGSRDRPGSFSVLAARPERETLEALIVLRLVIPTHGQTTHTTNFSAFRRPQVTRITCLQLRGRDDGDRAIEHVHVHGTVWDGYARSASATGRFLCIIRVGTGQYRTGRSKVSLVPRLDPNPQPNPHAREGGVPGTRLY